MDKQFKKLQSLGAGDFQHLNGSLEAHLKGTESILASWGANKTLRAAGLFHAAYGTAGFDANMVSLTQRQEIINVIGIEAEALVYLYCSCDRDSVFPQFGKSDQIQFKDRFTGTKFMITAERARLFCELTVANELELVYASDDFKSKYGLELWKLFESMKTYLSSEACLAYKTALSEFA
ncbi:DUF6817 domain-containing protein [Photobacterium sp. OFAV2-7]|uniref:DUF6817 domain-containing protein n=1 Tax=Photobacterium sp. OFAV2-7 TaxID=2917748 RepID=UPI001EF4D7FB|nr:hypothetical protein [Photobacterium sp. OFAV2-7]MCG7585830.1 hypothetical protein [Photobacterium sp. OFAV2-7]